jgi:O-antigen ligase/tetratricopeptide (TPR) repeat protein
MINPDPRPISPYATVVCLGLIVLVVAAPWFFGGVWASLQAPLLLATTGLLVVDLLDQLRMDRRSAAVPASLMPLALGIVLGLGQLLPLPEVMQSWAAPTVTQLRGDLLDDQLRQLQIELAAPSTRSVYPASGRHRLALLIMAAAVFHLAARHCTSRRALGWLLVAVSVLGGSVALFALVQRLTWNGMLYWRVPLTKGPGNPFGPYVNHNNAAGFLNLTLACALAWLIWIIWRKDQPSDERPLHFGEQYPPRMSPPLTSPRSALGQVAAFAARLDAAGMAVLVLIGLLAASVIVSLSRGSMLAMLGGGGVSLLLLILRRGNRRYALPMFLALGGAVFVTAWIGEAHTVGQRVESLWDQDLGESELRLRNWPDALKAAAFYIGWGSGLGTYPYAYSSMQHWHWDRQFIYAENQYLQTLVELGVVGLALLLVTILLTARAVWYLYCEDRHAGPAVAVMGAFALASQAVGGALDFGLYIPANMILMALLCGTVAGRAVHVARRQKHAFRGIWWRLPFACGPAISLMLLVACAVGWIELRRVVAVESALAMAPLEAIREQRQPAELDRYAAVWREAAQSRADDYRVHQHLAEVEIARARLAAFGQLRAEHPELPDQQLWDRTQPFELHRTAYQLQRRPEGQQQLAELQSRLSPLFRPAWRHLLVARHCCPLVAHLHLALAESCWMAAPDSDERIHIARARALAPGDAEIWFWSGVLDWNATRLDQALDAWRKSLELSPDYEEDIVRLTRSALPVERLLAEVLRADPEHLLRVARRDFAGADDQAAREIILRTADDLLQNTAQRSAKDAYLQGAVLELLGKPHAALQQYQQAVGRNPTELRWRYDYARLLLEQGQTAEAYAQARYCVRAGGGGRYQALLNRIRRQMPPSVR